MSSKKKTCTWPLVRQLTPAALLGEESQRLQALGMLPVRAVSFNYGSRVLQRQTTISIHTCTHPLVRNLIDDSLKSYFVKAS